MSTPDRHESIQKSTKIADSWQGSKKSKSLFFCRLVDFSKYTNAMYFFLRKICSFPRKTKKIVSSPTVDFASQKQGRNSS